MRILNILEMILGKPNQLITFPIHEEQLSDEVVAEAHKIFGVLVKENEPNISKRELERAINSSSFTQSEYEVHLIWSEI
jgi:Ca2+-binding EF-hand superfamily protein